MISMYYWRRVIIDFDRSKLEVLQKANAYLYVLQDVISTSPKQCHLSFGASINLNVLNNKTSLTILVDKSPFYCAAYANQGIIPSNWESNWESNKLYKEGVCREGFFEISATDSSSPELKWVQPQTETSLKLDGSNLIFVNKRIKSFYIGIGRAIQWGAGEKEINDCCWEESTVGCNCFFLLDSNSTTYFRPSDGIVLLISTQKWKNGKNLKDQDPISGYEPCYFELKEKETIILNYNNYGWIKKSGNPKLQLFETPILTEKNFEDCLVKDMPIEASDKPQKLHYGDPIKLYIPQNNRYIVSASSDRVAYVGPTQFFPRCSSSDLPINLLLSGGSGVIKDGDTVKIETTETDVGDLKILGAWANSSLYYYKDGYDQQKWIVHKKNKSDPEINYGDKVYFLNYYHAEQWLCVKDGGSWLTTKKDANVYWLISLFCHSPSAKIKV
jgi:hypothetical protein